MTAPPPPPLETLLRLIAATAPEPWYPSEYARTSGVGRDGLDPPLERLRLGGLIRLTDWVAGKGQGYALTPEGLGVLESRRHLAQLQNGQVPQVRAAAAAVPVLHLPAGAWERGEAIRDALLNPTPPRVSQALIALNVLVFVAGGVLAAGQGLPLNKYLAEGSTPIFWQTGALSGGYLMKGEWWRLLSTCFVHAGLLHLGMNMYALYALGPMAERLWGRWRFLALFLLAGLGGSVVAVLNSPVRPVVGASGAICGLIGSEAAWLWLNRAYLPPPIVSQWARNLVVNSLLVIFISMLPSISASAHFGGAGVGAAVALLLNAHRFGGRAARVGALVGLVALPLLGLGLILRSMQEEPAAWQRAQQDVELYDFLRHYVEPTTGTTQALLETFGTRAVPLLEKPPAERESEAAKQAAAELAGRRARLGVLLRQLEQAGPYQTELLENVRQLARDYVVASSELAQLAENALEKGEAVAPRGGELRKQQERVRQLRRLWYGQLGQDPPGVPWLGQGS